MDYKMHGTIRGIANTAPAKRTQMGNALLDWAKRVQEKEQKRVKTINAVSNINKNK